MMDKLLEQVAQVYEVDADEVSREIQEALQLAINSGNTDTDGFWKETFEGCDEIDVGKVIAFICVRAFAANMEDNADLQQRMKDEFLDIEESA